MTPSPARRRVPRLGALVVALLAGLLVAGSGTAAAEDEPAWATLTSDALGIAIDYPPGWSAERRPDGAVFRSPAGEAIELRRVAGASGEGDLPHTRCAPRPLPGGGVALVCLDTVAGTRIAHVALPPPAPAPDWTLATRGRIAEPRVFERMLDSLRQGSGPVAK